MPPEVLPPGEGDMTDEERKQQAMAKRPRFTIRGYTGAVMNIAGFYSPVVVDLAGLKARGQKIPILLDHDTSLIVGMSESIAINASGVEITGFVTGSIPETTPGNTAVAYSADPVAQKIISHAKNGFDWQASIGASIVRQEFLRPGEKATVNGREITGPCVIAREANLKETSIVAIGADDQTNAAIAASDSLGSKKGAPTMFEQWLAAKGFTDPAALDDSQKKSLQAMYDAEQAANAKAKETNGQATKSLDEIAAARRKEDQRIAEITRIAGQAIDDRPVMLDEIEHLAKVAMEAKTTTVQEFELHLMRAMRTRPSSGGGGMRGVDPRAGGKLIEAAICMSGKLDGIEKHFKPEVLEAAESRFPYGIGLNDLLVIVARENGFSAPTTRDVRALLQAAFGGLDIRANDGFSTVSLPGILSNVANKYLKQGFDAVETGWREVTDTRNTKDFKTNTSYAMTGGMTYEKVGPAGELKHATVGEVAYTNKVDTYGKMFAITRQDIINDDLGALTKVPMRLGRGAALGLNLGFWTEFLADAGSFYTSGHKNVSTGVGSALTSDGLKAAQLAFRKQTDPDGLPLGVEPRILLVPPELEIAANELMTSLIINTGGSSTETKVPNKNVWANKYRVVVSTYLSNSSITGYSAAAWYLIADPADLPVIEVAFLNGRETPIVESADADFNTLGIQYRGYFDWGVKKQEFRAAVRSAGS